MHTNIPAHLLRNSSVSEELPEKVGVVVIFEKIEDMGCRDQNSVSLGMYVCFAVIYFVDYSVYFFKICFY